LTGRCPFQWEGGGKREEGGRRSKVDDEINRRVFTSPIKSEPTMRGKIRAILIIATLDDSHQFQSAGLNRNMVAD